MNTDQIAAEAVEQFTYRYALSNQGKAMLLGFIKSAIEKAIEYHVRNNTDFIKGVREAVATQSRAAHASEHPHANWCQSLPPFNANCNCGAAHASEHLLDQIEGARNCIRKHFYNQAELILNDVLSQRPTPATASEVVPAGEVEGKYHGQFDMKPDSDSTGKEWEYVGGGYFREKGIPKGKVAEIIHAPELVKQLAATPSGGGEWTEETVSKIYATSMHPFRAIADARNAALRENNEKWRKEVKQFIERQHSLRDCGNDSRHGDQAARLDTKRLDLMETQGGQFAKIKGKSWRESADIHAAMRKTGEQKVDWLRAAAGPTEEQQTVEQTK